MADDDIFARYIPAGTEIEYTRRHNIYEKFLPAGQVETVQNYDAIEDLVEEIIGDQIEAEIDARERSTLIKRVPTEGGLAGAASGRSRAESDRLYGESAQLAAMWAVGCSVGMSRTCRPG